MKKPTFKLLVYAQQFIGECMPIYPLYALMFSERSGLNNSEIGLLFLGWVIIAMVAEVPTGIIADKFSRKSALVYSYLLQGSAFLIWLAFPSFLGYALGFLAWGIGYAFSSGTFQAYLYEELKAQGQTTSFSKIFARSQSLKLIGMVVAYIAASIIGAKNYAVVLVLSSLGSFIAAGITCLFPYKSKRNRAENSAESHITMLRSAVKEVRGNKTALAYVIALGVLMGMAGTMEEYTPLFYSNIGFSTETVPLILAAGLILSSLFGWYAHHLEHVRFATVASFVIVAGVVFFIGTYGQFVGLFGALIFMRLTMLAQTLFGASLQHTIQDGQRATIGSLASFGGEVMSLGFIGIATILFTMLGNIMTYRILAIIFIGLGIILVILGKARHLRVDAPTANDPTTVPGHPV